MRKKVKSPVTIVTAIKCTNSERGQTGIVVACDSRTTMENGTIRDDVEKLHTIYTFDGHTFLIAEAGNAIMAARAIEIIEQRAINLSVTQYRSIAECVEDSIAELKGILRKQFHGTEEELRKHFSDYSFELMLSHYYNGKPYIFTFLFEIGIGHKVQDLSCSIGCGAILADFLISRLKLEDFGIWHGTWTALYAVTEVKKFDGRCGGPTKMAVVKWKDSKTLAEISEDPGLAEAISEAEAYSEIAKTDWKKMVDDRIWGVIRAREAKEKLIISSAASSGASPEPPPQTSEGPK